MFIYKIGNTPQKGRIVSKRKCAVCSSATLASAKWQVGSGVDLHTQARRRGGKHKNTNMAIKPRELSFPIRFMEGIILNAELRSTNSILTFKVQEA